MLRNSHFRLLVIALIALSSTSCGYSFQGSGSILPDDIKTLAIAPVENKTTETELGIRFAESLRERFDRYGTVKVIEDTDSADVVLETAIEKVENKAASVTGKTDLELASDVSVTVSAELKTNDGRVLYKNPSISISSSYATVGSAVNTASAAFAQSGVGTQTLSNLSARELSRGEQGKVLEELLDEAARRIYLEAVAPDF